MTVSGEDMAGRSAASGRMSGLAVDSSRPAAAASPRQAQARPLVLERVATERLLSTLSTGSDSHLAASVASQSRVQLLPCCKQTSRPSQDPQRQPPPTASKSMLACLIACQVQQQSDSHVRTLVGRSP